MTSTRPQEVSLARLLRVYESKASSSAGGAPASPPTTPSRGRRGAPSPSEEDAPAPTTGMRSRSSDDERPRGPGGPPRPGGFDAVNDAKAHQHVEVMRGLVTEIRARDPATADAYAARVDRVASTVVALGEPSTTSSTSSSSRHRAAPYVTAAAGAASSSSREWRPYKPPPAPVRRRGHPGSASPNPKSSSSAAADAGASRPARREGGVKISDAGDAHIARQRAAQEELTDEMLELAGGIKANSLAMEASLRESRRELDVAEGALDRNLGGVRKERSRQKAIYETNRRGGCWTWIVLALVGVVFTWVVAYMRFTHDRTKFRV